MMLNVKNNEIAEEMDARTKEVQTMDVPENEADSLVLRIFAVLKTTTYYAFTVSYIYLLWALIHYAASHMYVHFCTPTTIYGFIISSFLIATPHCRALRWAIYNGASTIDTMWIVLGAWICSKMTLHK